MQNQICGTCRHWQEQEREPVKVGAREQSLIIQEAIAAARAADLGQSKVGNCRRYPPQLSLLVLPGQGLTGPFPCFPTMKQDEVACGEWQAEMNV